MPCSQLVTEQHWKASRVFNKILSRSQKHCSRWEGKNSWDRHHLREPKAGVSGKILKSSWAS